MRLTTMDLAISQAGDTLKRASEDHPVAPLFIAICSLSHHHFRLNAIKRTLFLRFVEGVEHLLADIDAVKRRHRHAHMADRNQRTAFIRHRSRSS